MDERGPRVGCTGEVSASNPVSRRGSHPHAGLSPTRTPALVWSGLRHLRRPVLTDGHARSVALLPRRPAGGCRASTSGLRSATPPILADVLRLPPEHGLPADAFLDVRFVVKRRGVDLPIIQQAIEETPLVGGPGEERFDDRRDRLLDPRGQPAPAGTSLPGPRRSSGSRSRSMARLGSTA